MLLTEMGKARGKADFGEEDILTLRYLLDL